MIESMTSLSPTETARKLWSASPQPRHSGEGSSTQPGRPEIARAAIAQLDKEGLARFSLRGVAKALDVPVTSLYWHIINKQGVLELARDHVVGQIVLADLPSKKWRESLDDYTRRLYATVIDHPWLPAVGGVSMVFGPRTLELSEKVFAIFSASDVPEDEVAFVNSTLVAFAVGSAQLQASTADQDAKVATITDAALDASRYPHLTHWLATARGTQSTQELQRDGFEYGLRRILSTI